MPKIASNQLKERALNKLKEGFHSDGGNLYLSIRGNSRAWVFRFKSPTTGKIRMLGLGALPDVTLDQARELARESRGLLKSDLDPLQQKRSGRLAIYENRKSFEEVANEYIENRAKQWWGKNTKAEVEALCKNYLFPFFEGRSILSITSDDVLTLLKSIWYEKTITGAKLQGLLDRIFKHALARGWFYGDNPARWKGFLETLLPKPTIIKTVEHRKACDWKEINTLYKRLKAINSVSNLVASFICLTACRSAEAREMRIDEIDFKEKLWILPATRSKTHKEHRVPLSDEAISIIEKSMAMSKGEYVFEYNRKPVYDKIVLEAVKDASQDPQMTLHGFRSTFRDWGSEATETQSEVLEMALGHAIKSKVESAYRRGDLLDKRRILMNEWAKYCCRK